MKQFNEQDHPRASDGKFTSKGGESSNPKDLQKDVEVKESSNKNMGQNDIESKAYEMLKGGAKEEDVVAWLEEQDPEADFYEMKDYVSQLKGNLEDNGHESPRGLQKDVEEPKISNLKTLNTEADYQKEYNRQIEKSIKYAEVMEKAGKEYQKNLIEWHNAKEGSEEKKKLYELCKHQEKMLASMYEQIEKINNESERIMNEANDKGFEVKDNYSSFNEETKKSEATPKLDKKTQKVYDLYKTEIDKKTNELNTHYSDEAIEKAVKTFGRGNEFEERKIRSQYQREKENIENGIKRYQKEMEKLVSGHK